MRKEVIIAIIIGFILGLIITYGIHTANKAVQDTTSPTPQTATPESTPSPTPSPAPQLTVTQPEDNIVIDQNIVTLSGYAEPNAIIAVISENADNLITTDENGDFSLNVDLISGINTIKVISITKENQEQEQEITVIYSTKI